MEAKDVRRLRLHLGLSQERFAQRLGVSLQSVRRWEGGVSQPLPIISVRLEELRKEAGQAQRRQGGVSMAEGRTRPEAGIEVSLGGLFKGIGSLFDLVTKMAEEGREEYTQSGEAQALGGKLQGVYGFSVKMGLGGKPVIEQFGNIRETETGPLVAETREPLVDVLDEGDRLLVIAELPGVDEKDIKLEVQEDILELTAETGDRKYVKEVLLPSAVDAASVQSSYRNGILEIRLAKKG